MSLLLYCCRCRCGTLVGRKARYSYRSCFASFQTLLLLLGSHIILAIRVATLAYSRQQLRTSTAVERSSLNLAPSHTPLARSCCNKQPQLDLAKIRRARASLQQLCFMQHL